MKKTKVVYTDEPLGNITIIEDFLPRPEDLVLTEDPKEKTEDEQENKED